jgi:hypothetical protein
MITDEQLVDDFNYCLDHYTNNGDKHYSDTPDLENTRTLYKLDL